MKRKYLLLLTVCCSCLLAAFICSGCNNRDSSQKHTAVKNHTSAKETVKPLLTMTVMKNGFSVSMISYVNN